YLSSVVKYGSSARRTLFTDRNPGGSPMRLLTLTALALIFAAPALAQDRDHVRPRAPLPAGPGTGVRPAVMPPAFSPPLPVATAKEAEEFVAQTEALFAPLGEHSQRLGWVAATYINDDSNWLLAKHSAEMADLVVATARAAARFDGVDVDPVVRRKLE